MSTTFYVKIPICRRNGIGQGKVAFSWFRKMPSLLPLLNQGTVIDEYGREYSLKQFAEEVAKGEEEEDVYEDTK